MSPKVILVTGANRGIGFCIVQALAQRAPEHTYLLGTRSTFAGEEAVIKLKELGITSYLEVVQLNITDDTQIAAAVSTISNKFGRLDSTHQPIAVDE